MDLWIYSETNIDGTTLISQNIGSRREDARGTFIATILRTARSTCGSIMAQHQVGSHHKRLWGQTCDGQSMSHMFEFE